MSDTPFTVRRLGPVLGAEIIGLDLSLPIGAGTAAALRSALGEHEVLFFRDQDLAPARHVELARVFGDPEVSSHPKFGVAEGHPEVAIVVNDAAHPPDINVWHTDMTFVDEPPAACVLYCVEPASLGGDTIWASMSAAWAALSAPLQAMLRGLTARHALRLDGIAPVAIAQLGDRQVSAVHPVVRLHPQSGRAALFVNSVYARRIEELPEEESRLLLSMLCELSVRPEFQVRFSWQRGSIAVWDNRCTQHYAVADYHPQRRIMHRVSVRGTRPTAAT
jgi:taurine dioxygenase